jgi:O-succinylbenzoic acid--CoA ligase
LADLLAAAAEQWPRALAVRSDDGDWTYAALDARATSLAGRLARLGVLPGAHVATLLPGSAAHVALAAAVGRVGGVHVPLDPRLPPEEVHARLGRAEASLAVAEGPPAAPNRATRSVSLSQLEATAPTRFKPAEPDPERVQALVFTSGTEGAARAAALTSGSFEAAARASAANLPLGEGDRWLACVPLFHVGGLALLTRCALAGAAVEVHARFDAERASAALDDGAALASMVPAMLRRVLDARGSRTFPRSLRAILLGGDAAPPGLVADARALGAAVLPTYGLTEACGQVASAAPGDPRLPPGACGRPLPGVAVRIVDARGRAMPAGEVGDIVVQGPSVMQGYHGDPAATAEALRPDGLHTGDVGFLDKDGYLWVTGRAGDRIVTGGENVDPAQVEAALLRHPAVLAAGVTGLPDATWGQLVAAAVVLRPGAAASAEQLAQHARRHLAGFQVPRRIVVAEALPRGPAGKLLRRALPGLFGPAP